MGLTAAERMRKYRERLKADPEKYEEKKKKHAAYVKSKIKKIDELPETEKDKIRKKWREAKRKQKEKKKHVEEGMEKKADKDGKAKKTKSAIYVKKYKVAQNRIKRLLTIVNRYKQKLYRANQRNSDLSTECDKLKCRNEILEISVKNAYEKCKTNKEKNVMKSLIDNDKVKVAQKKTYIAKVLGLKGTIRRTKKKTIINYRKTEIHKFFLRDDISKITAGKKECRTLNKNKQQIRYMTDTLFNLFKIYKEEGGKYSFSTFYKYKPFFVLSPNINNRETCLCIKHNNVELLFYALKKNLVLRNYPTLTDILKALCCNIKSQDCMTGNCDKCQTQTLKYDLDQEKNYKIVEWHQWERVDHVYVKNEKGEKVNKKTKKTKKVSKKGTVGDLIKQFEESLPAFKNHYFIWQHQQSQYRDCIKDIKPDEIFIICDFSENYQCKLPEEIQANHFAKNLISLHTGMIYTKTASQSFCTLSDDTTHEPAAIWAHLLPIIKLAKNLQPTAKVLHVYSDGPSSQYRQKKNFYLLSVFTKRLGFEYSTWSYTEAGHGKGVADGIGGCIKRALDRQVSFGNDVTDAVEAHELLQKCIFSVKCIYIPNSDFQKIENIVPNNLSTLVGTMKIHQIMTQELNAITYRNLSCFCGQKRGLCNCHSPKIHKFNQNGVEIDQTQNDSADISFEINILSEKEEDQNEDEEKNITENKENEQEEIKGNEKCKRKERKINLKSEKRTKNQKKEEKIIINKHSKKVEDNNTVHRKQINEAQQNLDKEKFKENKHINDIQTPGHELLPNNNIIQDLENIIRSVNVDEYNKIQERIKHDQKQNDLRDIITEETELSKDKQKEKEEDTSKENKEKKPKGMEEKKNDERKEKKIKYTDEKQNENKAEKEVKNNNALKDIIIEEIELSKDKKKGEETTKENKENKPKGMEEKKNNERKEKKIKFEDENQNENKTEIEVKNNNASHDPDTIIIPLSSDECNILSKDDPGEIPNSEDDIIIITPQISNNVIKKKRPLMEEYDNPRKLIKLEDKKECLKREKGRKSIRSVVTRSMNCKQCQSDYPFQLCKKCIACNFWICNTCSDNYSYSDFICISCLEG